MKKINEKYDARFFGLLIDFKNPQLDWSDVWYNFKLSLKNIKRFFYSVWWFRNSDYHYTLNILEVAIQGHIDGLTNDSDEVDEYRIPKIDAMKRVLEIIKSMSEDDYCERCGYDFNYDIGFKPFKGKGVDGEELFEMATTSTPEQNKINNDAIIKGSLLAQAELRELGKILAEPNKGLKTWWH